MLLFLKCLIVCYLSSTIYSDHAKLNVPRILLPYNIKYPTNFTLHADKGCYNWWSSSPNVAEVISSNKDCEDSVTISAVSVKAHRLSAIIYAKDKISNQIMKCDVIVDKISHITIKTTTRKLYLEDAPEVFEILAQNDQNDTFSTVDGIEVVWHIASELSTNIIWITNFENSSYETPASILEMERKGRHGYMVLIEALKTGIAKISAKLADPSYSDVLEASVPLSIVANLILEPSFEVFLQLYTTIRPRLFQVKHAKLHEILLDQNEQYYLGLDEEDTSCKLEKNDAFLKTSTLGKCTLKVNDKNSAPSQDLPQLVVHVVKASTLRLRIEPGQIWVLEVGRAYSIDVALFDEKRNEIWPTDDLRISVEYQTSDLNLVNTYINGTVWNLTPLKTGSTVIKAIFKSIYESAWKTLSVAPIVQEQEIEIFEGIKILPGRVIVPYDPLGKAIYEVQFQAKGGSGQYIWRTTNSSIAVISDYGLASIKPCLGNVTLVAADIRNPINIATGKNSDPMEWKTVLVLKPKSIEFVPYKIETFVSEAMPLYIKMMGAPLYPTSEDEKIVFSHCEKMTLNVTIKDPAVFEIIESGVEKHEDSCRSLIVKAKKPGISQLTVSYVYKPDNINIRATITIISYLKYELLDKAKALLTLGSSKILHLANGPTPLKSDPNSFYRNVIEDSSNTKGGSGLKIQEAIEYPNLENGVVEPLIVQPSLHHYQVTCREIGNWTVLFSVGNHPTALNPVPINQTISTTITCDEPAKIVLKPYLQLPNKDVDGETLPECPLLNLPDSMLPHLNYRDLEINVEMLDASGHAFSNFSSLALNWMVSDERFGALQVTDNQDQQIFHPFHEEGLVEITVTLTGYKHKQLTSRSHLLPRLTAQLRLKLVRDMEVVPSSFTLLNHHSISANVQIMQGSGYYYTSTNEKVCRTTLEDLTSCLVQMQYSQMDPHNLIVTPLRVGGTTLAIYDVCFAPTNPLRSHASTTIKVTAIDRIKISTQDKVEFGKEVVARIHILDAEGEEFNYNYLPGLSINPVVENDDIITVKSITAPSYSSLEGDLGREGHALWHKGLNQTALQFAIGGAKVGKSALKFLLNLKEQQSPDVIYSDSVEINVFPALTITPHNFTLIPGASLQVKIESGPPFHSSVKYESSDYDIANATQDGLITALTVGEIILTVHYVGYNSVPENEDPLESHYNCRASCHVKVVELRSVHLYAPLKRIYVGNEMPIMVHGGGEASSFFSFANTNPGFTVEWDLEESHHHATLYSPFDQSSNVQYGQQNDFRRTFKALKPGHVKLSVRVTKISPTHCGDKSSPHRKSDTAFHLSSLIPKHKLRVGEGTDEIPSHFKESISIEIIAPFLMFPSLETGNLNLFLVSDHNPSERREESFSGNSKSSPTILMSPNSEAKIVTLNKNNRWSKVVYTLRQLTMDNFVSTEEEELNVREQMRGGQSIQEFLSTQHITFDPSSGSIKTLETHKRSLHYSSALLTAHCLDTHTNTNHTAHIIIEIKPVSYITVVSRERLACVESHLPHFPLGTSTTLSIRYHDDTGTLFDAVSADILYRVNRYDRIDVAYPYNSDGISLQHNQPGSTLVEISALLHGACDTGHKSVCRFTDHLSLHSGFVLSLHPVRKVLSEPQQTIDGSDCSRRPKDSEKFTIAIGQIFCLTSLLASTLGGGGGPWYSEYNLNYVHEVSGLGIAKDNGTDHLVYRSAKNLSTYIKVEVEPVTQVKFTNLPRHTTQASNLDPLESQKIDFQGVQPENFYLSTAMPNKIFNFPFSLNVRRVWEADPKCLHKLHEAPEIRSAILRELNEIFSCRVVEIDGIEGSSNHRIDKLFQARVELDPKGNYVCQITAMQQGTTQIYESLNSVTELPSTLSIILSHKRAIERVSFNVWEKSWILDVLTNVPFYPSFQVEPGMIFLSFNQPELMFRIKSTPIILDSLKFTSEPSEDFTSDLIEIFPARKDGSTQNVASFIVKLLTNSPAYLLIQNDVVHRLEIYTPLTGQRETLLVNVKWSGNVYKVRDTLTSVYQHDVRQSAQRLQHLFNAIISNPTLAMYWFTLAALTVMCLIFGWYLFQADPYMTQLLGTPLNRSTAPSPQRMNNSFSPNLSPRPNIFPRISPQNVHLPPFIPSERKVFLPSRLWSLGVRNDGLNASGFGQRKTYLNPHSDDE